jgi:cell division protease FtsH
VNNPWFSKIAVWAVILLVMFTVFKQFDKAAARSDTVGYSDFLADVNAGRVSNVKIQEGPGSVEITAQRSDGTQIRTVGTFLDRGLTCALLRNNVKFEVKQREEPSLLMSILVSWGPMLLLIGVAIAAAVFIIIAAIQGKVCINIRF